jgi:hypothetical protein
MARKPLIFLGHNSNKLKFGRSAHVRRTPIAQRNSEMKTQSGDSSPQSKEKTKAAEKRRTPSKNNHTG